MLNKDVVELGAGWGRGVGGGSLDLSEYLYLERLCWSSTFTFLRGNAAHFAVSTANNYTQRDTLIRWYGYVTHKHTLIGTAHTVYCTKTNGSAASF